MHYLELLQDLAENLVDLYVPGVQRDLVLQYPLVDLADQLVQMGQMVQLLQLDPGRPALPADLYHLRVHSVQSDPGGLADPEVQDFQ